VPGYSHCTLCGVTLLAAAVSFTVDAPAPRPPYDPGQHVMQPTLFAPGLISTDLDESGGVFSPDGREFYFTLVAPYTTAPRFAMLVVSHFRNGRWELPQTLPFSGTSFDIAPHLNADGTKLYFASVRATQQNKAPRFRIWVSERHADMWSEPVPLPAPINQEDADNLDPPSPPTAHSTSLPIATTPQAISTSFSPVGMARSLSRRKSSARKSIPSSAKSPPPFLPTARRWCLLLPPLRRTPSAAARKT
jgi:WD40-like Beta Propeller Repeat